MWAGRVGGPGVALAIDVAAVLADGPCGDACWMHGGRVHSGYFSEVGRTWRKNRY